MRLIAERDPYVALALSEHPDGFVREAALRKLQPEDGSSLAALLRRANDWVRVVAELAGQRAVETITMASDDELAHALPLVFALTRQNRIDHRHLIERYRREIAQRAGLAKRLRRANRNGPVGVWAFRNLIGNDEREVEVALEGLRQGSPVSQLEAARSLAQDPGSWPLLIASKNSAIRRIGLDIAPEEAREAALVDPHAGVRNDARYLLGKRDYAAHYRAHLPAPGAISGLGETGRREDAALLAPLLTDPKPDVRRRALEAYARLMEEQAADELLLAVQDTSGKVKKAAIQALARFPVSIDADQVIDWKLNRGQAWALMDRVRRWSALLAVLRRLEEFPDAEKWLRRWADAARAHPAPPVPAEAADALVLTVELRDVLPESTLRAIREALKPWLR